MCLGRQFCFTLVILTKSFKALCFACSGHVWANSFCKEGFRKRTKSQSEGKIVLSESFSVSENTFSPYTPKQLRTRMRTTNQDSHENATARALYCRLHQAREHSQHFLQNVQNADRTMKVFIPLSVMGTKPVHPATLSPSPRYSAVANLYGTTISHQSRSYTALLLDCSVSGFRYILILIEYICYFLYTFL